MGSVGGVLNSDSGPPEGYLLDHLSVIEVCCSSAILYKSVFRLRLIKLILLF